VVGFLVFCQEKEVAGITLAVNFIAYRKWNPKLRKYAIANDRDAKSKSR
jgi:hypothetical protein